MSTANTPRHLEYWQLASVKGALKLESKGLKHSSGKSLRPAWAKHLGLKPRDSYEKYIETIQARMEVLLKEEQAEAAAKTDVAAQTEGTGNSS